MCGQQNKLKELFPVYGWDLVEAQTPNDVWFAEIWAVKSVWTPTNCFVFITFEVDPQWEDRANMKKGVWAINLTLEQPAEWRNDIISVDVRDDERFRHYIKPHFEKRIKEVFDSLNKLRLKFIALHG